MKKQIILQLYACLDKAQSELERMNIGNAHDYVASAKELTKKLSEEYGTE